MRKPAKKVTKRGKQTLVINISIAVAITFVISIVLFDALKPDKVKQSFKSEPEVTARVQEIPRTKVKAKRKRAVKNEDYKKYQAYFETKSDGIEDTSFNKDGVWAAE